VYTHAMTTTPTDRREVCPTCLGVTSIPARSRTITLEHVKAVHADTCPGRKAARKPDPTPVTIDDMPEALGSGLTIAKGRAPRRAS
jgi:hypothetical protein